MPKTPKKRPVCDEKKDEEPDPSTWGEDQKRREYYYDDAHGYEKYEAENDSDEDISDEQKEDE